MKHSFKTGFSFGFTSGIITTLGLFVGLTSGTHSKLVVIGAIITIAVADAFSDALGIHVAEESEDTHTPKEIWESTIATFLTKFIFALTFIIPVLIFSLQAAVIIAILWGFFCLTIFSYIMAKAQKTNPWKVIFEHLLIAGLVVIITHYLGLWIGKTFS